ncbi:MAG: hypothetical protein KDD58_11105 [Bdellovibrionales bacterium]|nr:hypothetical protein [Bdellovibrionales bacterium]
MKYILPVFCLFISLLITPQFANSATIAKVKGKKVYILLESRIEARKGDILEIFDGQGKKRGLVKVRMVKGNRALGSLKGKAQKGWSLKVRGASETSTADNNSEKKDRYEKLKQAPTSGSYYGVMAGFASDTMTATIDTTGNTTTDVDMSGSGFSGRLLFDYALWTSIWFRGMLGLENFATEGDQKICGANNDEVCDVEISYLALDLWGRYLFSTGTFRPWAGLGFNLLFPSSKASTAIDEESITSTSVFAGGLGFDWFFKNDMYIPVQFEYGMYPASETVKANYMALRFGVAIDF